MCNSARPSRCKRSLRAHSAALRAPAASTSAGSAPSAAAGGGGEFLSRRSDAHREPGTRSHGAIAGEARSGHTLPPARGGQKASKNFGTLPKTGKSAPAAQPRCVGPPKSIQNARRPRLRDFCGLAPVDAAGPTAVIVSALASVSLARTAGKTMRFVAARIISRPWD